MVSTDRQRLELLVVRSANCKRAVELDMIQFYYGKYTADSYNKYSDDQ